MTAARIVGKIMTRRCGGRWPRRADAAQLLLAAAADKEMLVLGLHGANRKHRLLAGSVSHQCVNHAACLVAVVRAGR